MILVIGAGPSGLATAYYLKQYGLAYRILERDSVGSVWRKHYDSLHLHTLKEVSSLPGLPMDESYPRFLSKDDVVRYLESYVAHFNLAVETGVNVTHAVPNKRGWVLNTSQGLIEGSVVVAATGIWSNPIQPPLPGQSEFGGKVFHAHAYKNADSFHGKRVLVVGAGNSGTEIAVEAAEVAAHTGLALRNGATFVPYPRSPLVMKGAAWFFRHAPQAVGEAVLQSIRPDFSDLGLPPPREPLMQAYPVVGYELPEAVKAGRVQVYPGLRAFRPGGVVFDDGQTANFEVVVLATGYRPATHFIKPYFAFNAAGWPILTENWASTKVKNLFAVGFWYPSTEGFLQSVSRVARQVAGKIQQDLTESLP